MVEGVSERVDTPTDRTRLRVGCSTVVIFCCRFGGDHANAAPVLSRRLTRRLTERTGEVGLARKFEGQRNMGQRQISLPEQWLGELEHGSRFSTASARSCKIAQKRTAPKADGQTRSLKQVGPIRSPRQWPVRFFPGVDAARNVTGCLQASVLRRLHSHRRAFAEGAAEDDSFAGRG